MSFLSKADSEALNWAKKEMNKKKQESIPTATVVEKYDDSGLKKKVNRNLKLIEGLTTLVQQVARSGNTARENMKQEEKKAREEQGKKINALTEVVNQNAIQFGENLATAMKSAQDKQQKEITKRMEAMRNEFEEKQKESNAVLVEVKYRQVKLNKRVNEVLNARNKVFTG